MSVFVLISICVNAQLLDGRKPIINSGRIIVKGQANLAQDTIGGRVEYIKSNNSQTQAIPQIVYNELKFAGISEKMVSDPTKKLVALTQYIADSNSIVLLNLATNIQSKGLTVQNGIINPSLLQGRLILNGDANQATTGTGTFRELELDNKQGTNVTNGGGFKVSTVLELRRGEFHNDISNNFSVGDSATIIRHVGSSLAIEPQFDKHVNVHYVGDGAMNTGGELPSDSTKLSNLYVENSGGVTLTKNVTVNDTLFVGSTIRTELDDTSKYVLTYTSFRDPIFGSVNSEIDGSIRRTLLRYDSSKVIFNNPYSYALFKSTAEAPNVKEITFRIKPRTFPPMLNGNAKVQRFISIRAKDELYNDLPNGVDFTVGYGFRYDKNDTAFDESNKNDVTRVKLERWIPQGNTWVDLQGSQPTTVDDVNRWVFAEVNNFQNFGDFAIGMAEGLRNMMLAGEVFLEGGLRSGQQDMGNELRDSNRIPLTPPDIYPYNLDPKRSLYQLAVIPDSAVDWILIELKSSIAGGKSSFVTCFVKRDGKLIDREGKFPINLYSEGIDSGDYYIAIRHRNHLSIITEEPVAILPSKNLTLMNFAKPENLLGRADALKALGFRPDGSLLFGMIAGDSNGDGKIDESDMVSTWDDRDYEGYSPRDINLNGIILTSDLNIAWNNRGRKTYVP